MFSISNRQVVGAADRGDQKPLRGQGEEIAYCPANSGVGIMCESLTPSREQACESDYLESSRFDVLLSCGSIDGPDLKTCFHCLDSLSNGSETLSTGNIDRYKQYQTVSNGAVRRASGTSMLGAGRVPIFSTAARAALCVRSSCVVTRICGASL